MGRLRTWLSEILERLKEFIWQILITVIAGVIVALIIQDARFAPPESSPLPIYTPIVVSIEPLSVSSFTPTPQLYRVINVENHDVLNVRVKPGVNNPIVMTIPPDATEIKFTGNRAIVEWGVRWNRRSDLWVEIIFEDNVGWVNADYLWPPLE